MRRLTPLLVVKISSDSMILTEPESTYQWQDTPHVAFSAKDKKVLATGRRALELRGEPGVEIVNGFDRIEQGLVNEPEAAGLALRVGLVNFLRSRPRRFLRPKPDVVFQLPPEAEFVTSVDEIRQLGASMGARKTQVWFGPDLDGPSLDRLVRSGSISDHRRL